MHRFVAKLVFQIFPDTVLLSELGWCHPALRVTVNLSQNEKNNWKTIFEFIDVKNMIKLIFSHFFHLCHFFGLRRATFIPMKIPAGTYRQWNPFACTSVIPHCIRKIYFQQIWTDEPMWKIDFPSLSVPICCKPRFSNFPWHRITLRVGMMPSCSTSHWKSKFIWEPSFFTFFIEIFTKNLQQSILTIFCQPTRFRQLGRRARQWAGPSRRKFFEKHWFFDV